MNQLTSSPIATPVRDHEPRHIEEHLIYEVDGLLYTTALADFEAVAEASYVPQAIHGFPAWLGTVGDERGLLPVLSLHQILDPSLEIPESEGRKLDRRLVIFRLPEFRCALHVQRCLGVFRLRTTVSIDLARSPLLRRANSGCRTAIQWNQQLAVILDPAALISPAIERQCREALAAIAATKSMSSSGRRRVASQEGMRAGEASPDAGGPHLSGTLAGGALAQVIQVLSLKKLTGELALETDGCQVSLFWNRGQLIHACLDGEASPDRALDLALRLRQGRFVFRRRAVSNLPQDIHRSTRDLIRDVMSAVRPSAIFHS